MARDRFVRHGRRSTTCHERVAPNDAETGDRKDEEQSGAAASDRARWMAERQGDGTDCKTPWKRRAPSEKRTTRQQAATKRHVPPLSDAEGPGGKSRIWSADSVSLIRWAC